VVVLRLPRTLTHCSAALVGVFACLSLLPPAAAQGVPVALSTRDPGLRGGAGIVSVPSRPVTTTAEKSTSQDPHAAIKVNGLTGTLNKDDVHQVMEARQADLDRCIAESQRTLRWVSGSIRFAFRVDGEGRVSGHRQLEQCLTSTLATTQFPRPAGRATAEFAWGLSVEPAGGKPLDTLKSKSLTSLLRKQSRSVFKTCEIRRRRARFQITAYVSPDGHLLSAGAVPSAPHLDDKVDCVLEEFSKWHMPRGPRSGKLSFELR
jgi:hypothetical protein